MVSLHNNAFFLHSFLDENIGDGKWSNAIKVIEEFKKFSNNSFTKTFAHALETLDVIDKIKTASLIVKSARLGKQKPGIIAGTPDEIYTYTDTMKDKYTDKKERMKDLTYKYDVFTEPKVASSDDEEKILELHTQSEGDRKFLPTLWDDSNKNFPNEFANEYKNLDFFIDIEEEKKIEDKINGIVNIVVSKNIKDPIFFPIGHPKHLLGLLLTKDYVIITNSGEGLEYHNNNEKKDANFPYPQCVLHFNRPRNDILKKILKEFIQIKYLYKDIKINSVYVIIYKLYFLHIINKSDCVKKEVIKIVDEMSRQIIKDNACSTQPRQNSHILKAAWIHPHYHEEVVYKLNITGNTYKGYHIFDNHNKRNCAIKDANLKIELFCDLLLRKSTYRNNCIVIEKNSKPYLPPVYYDEEKSPTKILSSLLNADLKNMFSTNKITSAFSDAFYAREQYSGSCTFNGTLLAVSLLGENNIAVNLNKRGLYADEYNKLKTDIQKNQITYITSELEKEPTSKLDEKDRLVVEALEVKYAGGSDANIKNLINLLKKKLPDQVISSPTIIYRTSKFKTHYELYKNIGTPKIDIIIDVILVWWDKVMEVLVMGNGAYYNDFCFVKFALNPFIKWINEYERSTKAMDTITKNNELKLLLKKIEIISGLDQTKYAYNALCMTVIYTIFKIIDIKQLFNEQSIQKNLSLYKQTHDESKRQQVFQYFFLTSAIDKDAHEDLCKILNKYQFLILDKYHMAEFINYVSLIGLDDNTKIDIKFNKYNELMNIDEIKCLYSLKTFTGNDNEIKITKIVNIKNIELFETQMADKDSTLSFTELTGKSGICEYFWDISGKTVNNNVKKYIFIEFSNQDATLTTLPIVVIRSSAGRMTSGTGIYNATNAIIVLPNKNDLIIEVDEVCPCGASDFHISVMFSHVVVGVNMHILNNSRLLENNLYDITVPDDETKIITKNIYGMINKPNAQIINILYVKHLIEHANYDKLLEYLELFEVNRVTIAHFDSITWDDCLYFPLLQLSPTDLGETSIIKYNKNVYEDNSSYNFYNSHNIMELYKTEVKELCEYVKTIILENNIINVIKKLRALAGDIDDDVINGVCPDIWKGKEISEQSISHNLKLTIGNETVTYTLLTTEENKNDLISFTDSATKKKVTYKRDDGELRINHYKIYTKEELLILIRRIQLLPEPDYGKKKQMIENMMYYAQDIPDFVIGLNDDLASGIIAFLPQTQAYYEKHFYDSPWVDTTDNMKSLFTKRNIVDKAEKLIWVKFDIDLFNSTIPVLESDIISPDDNYMVSFTLFCDYLLMYGKYEIFGLLIPQLVSVYFAISETTFPEENKLNDKHRQIIDFIIQNDYIISPYRYYYINKLKRMINGKYDEKTIYEHTRRKDYYPRIYQKVDDVKELTDRMDGYIFDMKYYN